MAYHTFYIQHQQDLENTDGWLREIGKYTGKEEEVEELIKEERAKWEPKLNFNKK